MVLVGQIKGLLSGSGGQGEERDLDRVVRFEFDLQLESHDWIEHRTGGAGQGASPGQRRRRSRAPPTAQEEGTITFMARWRWMMVLDDGHVDKVNGFVVL